MEQRKQLVKQLSFDSLRSLLPDMECEDKYKKRLEVLHSPLSDLEIEAALAEQTQCRKQKVSDRYKRIEQELSRLHPGDEVTWPGMYGEPHFGFVTKKQRGVLVNVREVKRRINLEGELLPNWDEYVECDAQVLLVSQVCIVDITCK